MLKIRNILFRARLRPQIELEKRESISRQGDVKNSVKERENERENEFKQKKELEKRTLLGDEVQWN